MTEGDFVVVTRGEPHVIYSDSQTSRSRLSTSIDRRRILALFVMEAASSRSRR